MTTKQVSQTPTDSNILMKQVTNQAIEISIVIFMVVLSKPPPRHQTIHQGANKAYITQAITN